MSYRKKPRVFDWQSLEPRKLLAFATLSPGGTLIVNGTDGPNQIRLVQDAQNVVASMDATTMAFAVHSVKAIAVDAGAGDDSVSVQLDIGASIIGGDGDDRLVGGTRADTINGGTGNDIINPGAGNDVLTGGDGTDTLDYGDRSEGFTVQLGFVNSPETALTRAVSTFGETDHGTDYFEVVGGTEFNDAFTINIDFQHTVPPASITFLGRGGNDWFGGILPDLPVLMSGGPGNDSFPAYSAGPGQTTRPMMLGGPGNDRFQFYKDTQAVLDGGPGGDTLDVTLGAARTVDLNDFSSFENVVGIRSGETVLGTGAGNYFAADPEMQTGNYRSFTIYGKGGNDTIIGSPGRESLLGGDGDDIISGGGGNDTIYGGDGNDIINGNNGNDRIYGGAGNDTLLGSGGRDRLYGEAGDDLLSTRDNKIDTLYGGDGNDSAKLDNTAKVKDLFHEIESLV